jgi:hypothetical protein
VPSRLNARSAPYPFPLMPDALVTRISIVTTPLRRRLEGLATRRATCNAGQMRSLVWAPLDRSVRKNASASDHRAQDLPTRHCRITDPSCKGREPFTTPRAASSGRGRIHRRHQAPASTSPSPRPPRIGSDPGIRCHGPRLKSTRFSRANAFLPRPWS